MTPNPLTSDGLDLSQGVYGRYEQPTTSVRPRAYDASSRRARLKQLWRAADTDENHNKEGGNGADYSPSNRRPDACDRINLESGGAWKTDRRLHRPCTRAPARLRDAFLARLPSSNKRRTPQSGERQRGGLAAYSVSLRLVRRLLNAADGIYLASHCGARRKPEMPAVSGCGTWFIQPHCPFGQWP